MRGAAILTFNKYLSPGQTTANNCKTAFSLHVVERVSDDNSFQFGLYFYLTRFPMQCTKQRDNYTALPVNTHLCIYHMARLWIPCYCLTVSGPYSYMWPDLAKPDCHCQIVWIPKSQNKQHERIFNKKCGHQVQPTWYAPARLKRHKYSILFPELRRSRDETYRQCDFDL